MHGSGSVGADAEVRWRFRGGSGYGRAMLGTGAGRATEGAGRELAAGKANSPSQGLDARRGTRCPADDEPGAAGPWRAAQIRDAVLGLPETQMAGTVAAYVSVGSEPDTGALIFALLEARDLRAAAVAATGSGPGLGVLRGTGFADAGPARAARADRAAARCDRDHQRGPGDRAGLGRRPPRATGLAAAAAPTTGPWPGLVRRFSRLHCSMTTSSQDEVPAGPLDCRSGRRQCQPKESPGFASRCYHLAVDRGEC